MKLHLTILCLILSILAACVAASLEPLPARTAQPGDREPVETGERI
jgi:hypothetical protein